ncbi:MAG: chromosomal replication initiator protein DnaA [Desulfobulbus sp.]|jgi:chromosomal replication initiator protein
MHHLKYSKTEMNMLWNTIKETLRGVLPPSEYGLWIGPLECLREEDQLLELVGPDRFFCAWVQDRYLDLIRQTAADLGGTFEIRLREADAPCLVTPAAAAPQLRLPGVTIGASRLRSLHPAFTFEEFMVGESNLLAQSACKALAEGDPTFGNCLFINSTTGLGKSHLTQAVVHQVLQLAPATRMHYLTAQQFTAEMVKNIRARAMEQFSRKYINECDLLLVEDVHTLTGKNKTQEELNIILDYLIKAGRRVILTSALPPARIEGLDDDFRSRMSSGLVTGIESPDYETRARIIRRKMQTHGLHPDEDLVGYMADRLKGDVRRIESALIGIKAQSRLRNTPPDLNMVREVVGGLVGETAVVITGESIRELVGRQFKVSVDDLRSRSRKRAVTFPRQVAMYLTRKYTNHSLSDIGGMYNRDHSTVLYAIKVVTRDMAREPAIRQQIEQLCARLKN